MSFGRRSKLLAFTAAVLLYMLGAVPQANATGSYDNANIADIALRYVGQWGGNACADAHRSGLTGSTKVYPAQAVWDKKGRLVVMGDGQCKAFVNCIVWMASNYTQWVAGSDYFRGYLDNGGVEITDISQLSKGDIVQVGQGIHTFIIVGRRSDNVFNVVDSNHNMGDEMVANYDRSFALGGNTRAFRMGKANTGPFSVVQPISVGPSDHVTMGQPLEFSYRIKNTSGSPASIQRLVVAIAGPGVNNNLTQNCDWQSKLSLQPNEETVCHLIVGTGFGQVGTYRFWADWQDWNGKWHEGQLGSSQNFFYVSAATTLVAAQPISVGPSDHTITNMPVTFSYRIRNTSGYPASLRRIVVGVRGPAGDDLTQDCQGTENLKGLNLAPNQEWTCTVSLPTGYGSVGTFRFYADWQDGNQVWHAGMLGSTNNYLYVAQGPTLTVMQPISVGPNDHLPQFTRLYWSFRVRNTSGSVAIIRQFTVAVRGPGGDNLDTACLGGSVVTMAPGDEFICYAERPTGYGSPGQFRFWADWQDMNYVWHPGYLGSSMVLTLS